MDKNYSIKHNIEILFKNYNSLAERIEKIEKRLNRIESKKKK